MMTADPTDCLWADVLQQLKGRLARETFNMWLLGSHVLESGEGTLTIGFLRPEGLPWLEHQLRPVIEQTLHLLTGRPIALQFVACPPEQDEVDEDQDEASPAGDPPVKEPPQRRKKMRRRASPAVTSPSSSSPPIRAGTGRSAAGGHKPAKELTSNDFYIRLKTAFRRRALRLCKGAPLPVLVCLWCHVNKQGVAWPSIETIMRETGYSRGVVCNAIAKLEHLGLIIKRPRYNQTTEYIITAYAWFGSNPAPALFEEQEH